MKLKLTSVEAIGRHQTRILSEEVLEGESGKEMTKGRARRLIKRFHPEYRTSMVAASEFPADWCVHSEQTGSNTWLYVYASKVRN